MILVFLRKLIRKWVLAKDEDGERTPEERYFNDFPTGSLKITTPDGKTSVSMDIVTAADERKAQQLTALLLTGSKIKTEEMDSFLGLTD